jgi:hypothetical protein
MIVSTMASHEYRDPAVAIGNLVNASILLIVMPIRKLHLLCQSKYEKDEVYAPRKSRTIFIDRVIDCLND